MPTRREADHLRLIHALTEAEYQGCRVDLSQVGRYKPVLATECAVSCIECPDGSLELTPIPLVSGLRALLGAAGEDDVAEDELFHRYRDLILSRLGQLEGTGNEGILRIGSTLGASGRIVR